MRRSPLLVTVITALVVLTGCQAAGHAAAGAAGDAGRAAAGEAGRAAAGAAREAGGAAGSGADDVVRSLPDLALPRPGVGVEVPADGTVAVQREADEMTRPYVVDLSVDDARRVVRAACVVNDINEIAGADTRSEAATTAVVAFGGRATLGARAAQLADDLDDAGSFGDDLDKAAAFYVCERA